MEFRILAMIATAMEACMGPNERRRGHPPAATVRVLATLRQFLREGMPWRSLRASAEKVSGSTLRRHLDRWAEQGLLTRVHAVLVRLLRGSNPDLIVDSYSVRARR
jgi:transposase